MDSKMPVGDKQARTRDKDLALSGNRVSHLTSAECSGRTTTGKDTAAHGSALPHDGRQKTSNSNRLVLQVYNHMKVQRRLEEDRNSKISRVERKRQRLKRDLEAASSSKASSRDGDFAPRWTYHRGGYGPLGQRTNSQSDEDTAAIGNLNSAKTQSAESKTIVPPLGDLSNVRDENGQDPSTGAEQTPEAPRGIGQSRMINGDSCNNSSLSPTNTPQNSHRSTRDFAHSTQSFSHDSYYTMKGPGKFHIKLGSSSTRKSSSGSSPRKAYQWDAMPAGCLLPAHLPVVNLGDNILKLH